MRALTAGLHPALPHSAVAGLAGRERAPEQGRRQPAEGAWRRAVITACRPSASVVANQ